MKQLTIFDNMAHNAFRAESLNGLPMFDQSAMEALGIAESEGLSGTAELYERVNAKIVALMEKDGLFWRKPWGKGKKESIGSWPFSYPNKYAYSGTNVLMLAAEQMENGYSTPYWITLKKANDLGGTIRKGEKSTEVVFWKMIFKDEKGNTLNITAQEARERQSRGQKISVIPMLKSYRVFNLDQTEGIEKPKESIMDTKPRFEHIWIAEAAWQGMGNKPRVENTGNAKAYYSPGLDSINMPYKSLFTNPQAYYQVLFHELTHATGHTSRLNRLVLSSFGDTKYSFEELVAELGASYLMSWCGLAFDESIFENSAAYIKGWASKIKEELKKDRTWLFKASSDASKAMEHILGERLRKPELQVFEAEALEWEASEDGLGNPAISAMVKMMLADLAADQTGKLAKALEQKYKEWRKSDSVKAQAYEQAAASLGSTAGIPYSAAYNAFRGTSFSPEKRAVQVQEDFKNDLNEFRNYALKLSNDEAKADEELAVFAPRLQSYYMGWLQSRSGLMSSMIVGPARFPVDRMRKRNQIVDSKLQELIKFIERAKDAVLKKYKPYVFIRSGSKDAVELLEKKIQGLERAQTQMVEANKIIRLKIDNSEKTERLKALLKISDKQAEDLLKPDFAGSIGFASSALTNNSAAIRDAKQKLEREKKLASYAGTAYLFEGGKAEINAEQGRFMLYFDSKPSEEKREAMKKNGFKWSPSNEAWQSFIGGASQRWAMGYFQMKKQESNNEPSELEIIEKEALAIQKTLEYYDGY